jgi:hypothetical protein
MIKKISIYPLSEATSISYKENFSGYNAWISATDDHDKRKVQRMRNNFTIGYSYFKFFSQFFYDWSDEDCEPYIKGNIETMGPQKYHIQNIITFIKENLVDSKYEYNLGINCFAGVSRSTALGIIAWALQGKPPEDALASVLEVRPQAWPNLRILRFAKEITGVDVLSPVEEMVEEKKGKIFVPPGGYVW